MRRLFTFGCSYTNYRWSTWADCLAPEFDYFENWGQSGGGNHYIFNSVMEADQRHHFGANDTVVVCWSTILRDDRYAQGRWHTIGGMFTTPIYQTEYLKTHVDERGCVIRDFAYIKAVKVLLESRPDLNWRFLSLANLKAGPRCESEPGEPKDVMEVYGDVLASILPSYQEVLFPGGWPDRDGDSHPRPEEHLAYLDAVLPGWVTKQSTRVKMHDESINLNKNPRKSGMSKVTRL
jgi:hypothetical protein